MDSRLGIPSLTRFCCHHCRALERAAAEKSDAQVLAKRLLAEAKRLACGGLDQLDKVSWRECHESFDSSCCTL